MTITRAALITGGSSGIGKAIARALAEDGHAVTICGRDRGKLDAAVAELSATGSPVQGVPTDLADAAAIDALLAEHRAAYGRMDVLVNSAASATAGVLLADLTTAQIDNDLAVDLRASFLTMRGSVGLLTAAGAEHGKALVVNVSSYLVRTPVPGVSVYNAAKAGLHALSEAVQTELAGSGVQVTTFVPGAIDTPLSSWLPVAGVGLEELVRPEDLAEGVRFLLRTSGSCLVREMEFVARTQASIGERVQAYAAAGGSF
jgi:NAD(P)-dependent dehydrogenase (short-subunit alcohol dehydrogenase family)